jgi:hypothetical protein
MIIETSANRFYQVKEVDPEVNPGLEHVWIGFPVKRIKGKWVTKGKGRTELVRKAATKVVEA